MSASRYAKSPFIQPIRKLDQLPSDIIHTFNQYETIDQLAMKYYKDMTLAWIIMAANPDEYMEWFVKPGTQIRVPFPLSSVWARLGIKAEI